MPGIASHAANTDGGSIIANNVISDFGHGDAHWIWGSDNVPSRFDHGQEPDDPPLTDVIVQGNMLYNSGPPGYRYAVVVEGEPNAPRGLHFAGNVFPAGSGGVSNVVAEALIRRRRGSIHPPEGMRTRDHPDRVTSNLGNRWRNEEPSS